MRFMTESNIILSFHILNPQNGLCHYKDEIALKISLSRIPMMSFGNGRTYSLMRFLYRYPVLQIERQVNSETVGTRTSTS